MKLARDQYVNGRQPGVSTLRHRHPSLTTRRRRLSRHRPRRESCEKM